MESLNKKQYHVRELTTRSVTLFPNRAQVVRDLKDLQLKVSIITTPNSLHDTP